MLFLRGAGTCARGPGAGCRTAPEEPNEPERSLLFNVLAFSSRADALCAGRSAMTWCRGRPFCALRLPGSGGSPADVGADHSDRAVHARAYPPPPRPGRRSGHIVRAFALPPLTDPNGVSVGTVFGFCNMLFRLVQAGRMAASAR